MRRYAILQLPSINRVYNASSWRLMLGELEYFNASVLNNRITNIQSSLMGGVAYMTFDCDPLSGHEVAFIANLSFVYALFESTENEGSPCLKPILLKPLDQYDSDLLSILKFPGKTNEQFTRLLLNVTLMASAFADHMHTQRLTVFDPLCGRGTTLNQALMYGYHAAGVEIDKNDYDTYNAFINRWLKEKRLKHKSADVELRKDGQQQARRLSIRFARDKASYKADDVQTLDFVHTDTLQANSFFKMGFCHLIVTDLPYGVKHGSRSTQGLKKSPARLLEEALPVWKNLLCQGGAIGIAWNTHLARKADIVMLLEQSGLTLRIPTMPDQFRHRVDQAIVRDIVVATRL